MIATNILISDENECASDISNTCNIDAICSDTEGSFTCSCKAGFTGNGITCRGRLIYLIVIYIYM